MTKLNSENLLTFFEKKKSSPKDCIDFNRRIDKNRHIVLKINHNFYDLQFIGSTHYLMQSIQNLFNLSENKQKNEKKVEKLINDTKICVSTLVN